jgi:hypothetical protein
MTTANRSMDAFDPVAAFGLMLDDQRDLSKKVSVIVQKDSALCDRFVGEINEAVLEYRLHKAESNIARRDSKKKRLLDLAKCANLTAKILDGLDRNTASIIAEKSKGERGAAKIRADAMRLRSIADAASAMAKSIRKRQGGNALAPELSIFISKIGFAFAAIFRRRPSSATDSIFSKVLKMVVDPAEIGGPPARSALKTSLKELSFEGLPPLKRGRRKKSK